MKQIHLFHNKLIISIEAKLWDYLCNFRFFSTNPSDEELETEFIIGTGITESSIQLWDEASSKFSSYINELMQIYNQTDYFMKLRNLVISGGKVENLNLIIDGIT